jgi:hypothetical protein
MSPHGRAVVESVSDPRDRMQVGGVVMVGLTPAPQPVDVSIDAAWIHQDVRRTDAAADIQTGETWQIEIEDDEVDISLPGHVQPLDPVGSHVDCIESSRPSRVSMVAIAGSSSIRRILASAGGAEQAISCPTGFSEPLLAVVMSVRVMVSLPLAWHVGKAPAQAARGRPRQAWQRSVLSASFGGPLVPGYLRETRGFASPPRGEFALSVGADTTNAGLGS